MDPVGHRPRRAIVVALATAALAVVAIVSLYVGRPAQAASVVMVGAGDIAHCSTTTDEATAKLLDGIFGTVFTLGDNVYNSGTRAEFANCYGPTWGRHKARTKPSVGNHEYLTSGASGYFGYFGAAAETRRRATIPTTAGTGTSSCSTPTAPRSPAPRVPRRIRG